MEVKVEVPDQKTAALIVEAIENHMNGNAYRLDNVDHKYAEMDFMKNQFVKIAYQTKWGDQNG